MIEKILEVFFSKRWVMREKKQKNIYRLTAEKYGALSSASHNGKTMKNDQIF